MNLINPFYILPMISNLEELFQENISKYEIPTPIITCKRR